MTNSQAGLATHKDILITLKRVPMVTETGFEWKRTTAVGFQCPGAETRRASEEAEKASPGPDSKVS